MSYVLSSLIVTRIPVIFRRLSRAYERQFGLGDGGGHSPHPAGMVGRAPAPRGHCACSILSRPPPWSFLSARCPTGRIEGCGSCHRSASFDTAFREPGATIHDMQGGLLRMLVCVRVPIPNSGYDDLYGVFRPAGGMCNRIVRRVSPFTFRPQHIFHGEPAAAGKELGHLRGEDQAVAHNLGSWPFGHQFAVTEQGHPVGAGGH